MDLIRSCSILVQNNQFIFKMEGAVPFIIWFGSFKERYYRPYYQYLDDVSAREIMALDAIFENIADRNVNLLMSDDALQMDLRMIKGFLMERLNCFHVETTYQSMYVSQQEKRYIALTKTCRCVAMKYIKEGRLIQDCFLPVTTLREEILEEMQEMHSDIPSGKVPVFIIDNQEDLAEISSLGKIVTSSEILENYEQMRKRK